jgi:hypothetical protein
MIKVLKEGINLKDKNIFIHSTTFEGFQDLLQGNIKDYLSVSSFQGSKKFIEKGYETIYIILYAEDKDIDFRAWGDVGWKGGTPKKTSYDEIGILDWDIKGFYIPDYLKSNKNLIYRTLLTRDYYYEDYEQPPIISSNYSLVNKIEVDLQNEFWTLEDKGYEFNKIYKVLLKKYQG